MRMLEQIAGTAATAGIALSVPEQAPGPNFIACPVAKLPVFVPMMFPLLP